MHFEKTELKQLPREENSDMDAFANISLIVYSAGKGISPWNFNLREVLLVQFVLQSRMRRKRLE